MGKAKSIRKNTIKQDHIENIKTFIRKILKLNQSERLEYFKSITTREIKFISEIVLNFLKKNIRVDFESFKLLKRVKKHLYCLSKKNNSCKNKRIILTSLKGLHIINIILPLALESLNLL